MMIYLLDFPDGTQMEEDFATVHEARKCAFNLLQTNAVTSEGFSVRLDRMTRTGLESMGQVNLEGFWTRDEPPEGRIFFEGPDDGKANWKPITRRAVVIYNEDEVMFDADLFTREGVKGWLANTCMVTDPEGITMERVRMMPSFDDEGESCWVCGEGPRSCTFWKVEIPEVDGWNRC